MRLPERAPAPCAATVSLRQGAGIIGLVGLADASWHFSHFAGQRTAH